MVALEDVISPVTPSSGASVSVPDLVFLLVLDGQTYIVCSSFQKAPASVSCRLVEE